jgi:rRNA maturation RNase YbeY
MDIRIFYDEVKFRIKDWKKIVAIIVKIIIKEKRKPGNINFVITSDPNLKELNFKFLKHNYYTDVIAFDYNEKDIVNGEIYVSFDTVKKNSINYKVSLKSEILRVIFHGVLHLCGYEDKTNKEKMIMRKMEELWIGIYNSYN